jgi:hypothetical protein
VNARASEEKNAMLYPIFLEENSFMNSFSDARSASEHESDQSSNIFPSLTHTFLVLLSAFPDVLAWWPRGDS